MYCYYAYYSPVGKLTIAGDENNIVGLWIDKQRYYMDILEKEEAREKETPVIRLAEKWLDKYFNNGKPEIDEVPIKFVGSDFRKQVWEILARIPYGEVVTYGDVAKQVAKENGIAMMSARAVGGAVGRNPISIIVPCHRVVGAGGSLTGYSGGMRIKNSFWRLKVLTCQNLMIRCREKHGKSHGNSGWRRERHPF